MPRAIDSAYVSIYPVTEGFGKAVATAMHSAGAQGGAVFGSSLEAGVTRHAVFAGNVMSSILTKAAGAVGRAWSGAIGRVDTMNQFPRQMAAMGYSAEEAAKYIEILRKRIQGLPTHLDDIAATVQMLTPITGSMKSATEVALAFNDAVLASGKDAYQQSRALTQFSQMMATGQADMQSWRVLQEVMPMQLDQIAKSMLGATATGWDLREAINAGKVSFKDFNKAIIKLDKEGYNGLASFEEQAKGATAGIRTSFENAAYAITTGLANFILTFGADKMVAFFDKVKSAISDFFNMLQPLAEFLGYIWETVSDYIANSELPGFLEEITPLIYGVGTALVVAFAPFIGNPVVAAIAGIAVALSTLWAKSEKFRNATKEIWDNIIKPILEKLVKLVEKVIAFIKRIPEYLERFFAALGRFAQKVKGVFDAVINFFKRIVDWFKALPGRIIDGVASAVQTVIEWFKALPGRIASAIGDLGRRLWQKGKELIQGFWDGIKAAWQDFLDWANEHLTINGVVLLGNVDYQLTNLSPTPTARGGIVTRATNLIAGEGGPEAIIPLSNPHLKPFMEDGGDTYNLYIDRARINDNEAMRRATYDYLMTMKRYAKMQGA